MSGRNCFVVSKNITNCKWYEHFKCVFDGSYTPVCDFLFENNDTDDKNEYLTELNRSVYPQEVPEAIRKLTSGKAHGCDGIPADMLTVAGDTAVQFLTNFSTLSVTKECTQKSGRKQ